MTVKNNGSDGGQADCREGSCEHCNCPGHAGDKCCWATAMEIRNFQKRVKHKYIIEVIFDLIVSTASVSTDIIALIMYFNRRKYSFALLTAIPVLLPTFVFTNVYLADESTTKKKASRVVSTISSSGGGGGGGAEKSRRSSFSKAHEEETSGREKVEPNTQQEKGYDYDDHSSNFDSESTDSSIRSMDNKGSRCKQAIFFHWPCLKVQCSNVVSCFSGCAQCFCQRDHKLRRRGAIAVKNSLQRLFKYGFGTFVLRFIAWMWYVKALIFGLKAYRQPKKFMHIAAPDTHWSYELLIRLDFLQAALENAPQCVIQLYALITQPDEDAVLGIFTLTLSFIDFIRVAVSVHWDMNKGPVNAPGGCYRSILWKMINTSSWILIYLARSSALALIFATSKINEQNPLVWIPLSILLFHIFLFGKLLSKAEYGTAAQKIFVTVFISLFFLPELDSSIHPQTVQFYYATIIIQNTFFILPWRGFEGTYCITNQGYDKERTTMRPPHPNLTTIFPGETSPTRVTYEPPFTIRMWDVMMQNITAPPPSTELPLLDCLIDPLWITLAVPTMTIFGVIFRLLASQKMYDYKNALPEKDTSRETAQNKLESSISKLFSRNWTQMTVNEMLQAFLRMLKKEVIIVEEGGSHDDDDAVVLANEHDRDVINKRFSFLSGRLQADFLASQSFIRQSFSLMTRTTRSHDINIAELFEKSGGDQENNKEAFLMEYNSDSELTQLTFRKKNGKKRPRIPRSRNVSESIDVLEPNNFSDTSDTTFVQVDFPNGAQVLEMCWI